MKTPCASFILPSEPSKTGAVRRARAGNVCNCARSVAERCSMTASAGAIRSPMVKTEPIWNRPSQTTSAPTARTSGHGVDDRFEASSARPNTAPGSRATSTCSSSRGARAAPARVVPRNAAPVKASSVRAKLARGSGPGVPATAPMTASRARMRAGRGPRAKRRRSICAQPPSNRRTHDAIRRAAPARSTASALAATAPRAAHRAMPTPACSQAARAARARTRSCRGSILAGSSIQDCPAPRRRARSSARRTPSKGRTSASSAPSGHAGDGATFASPASPRARTGRAKRITSVSAASSAVCASSRTRSPRTAHASARSRWRASRARPCPPATRSESSHFRMSADAPVAMAAWRARAASAPEAARSW